MIAVGDTLLGASGDNVTRTQFQVRTDLWEAFDRVTENRSAVLRDLGERKVAKAQDKRIRSFVRCRRVEKFP